MSEILFLGTGAADWFIEEKGDFLRRNSAALLNNELMIDCGAHIFDFRDSLASADLYDNVSDVIITHNHSDHFNKSSLETLAKSKKIRVGGDGRIFNEVGGHENVEFTKFKPLEEKKMGNYTVMPLLANHDIVADGENYAYHYIIRTPDGKTLFYGLDGAWFLRSSWNEMKKHKFDVMIFDCTVGDMDDWRLFEHNTIPMLRTMIKAVEEKNLLKEGGKLVASHLARTLHVSCEETEKILKELNMITAYDGMKIEF